MTSERECRRAGDHASTRSETRNSDARCCCGGVLSCRVVSSRVELGWCRIQVNLMQRRLAH